MNTWKKVKWDWDGVEWGPYGPDHSAPEPYGYQYYIWWKPNWLPKKARYFGYERFWWDGPHASFGFWFFNIGWTTKWTKPPKEFMS